MGDEQDDTVLSPPVLTDPIALRLARLVIQQWHDDGPADTFTLLARRGRQSLNELKQHFVHTVNADTSLRDDRARAQARAKAIAALQTDLLILMQHNYVRCYRLHDHSLEPEEKQKPNMPLMYEADIGAAITALSKPHALAYADEYLEPLEYTLISVLLQRGRLRMDQLHAYVGQELAPREGNTQEAPKHGIKEVARALRALLVQRLVERAPSCTEPTPKPQDKKKPKRNKDKAAEERHHEEVRAAKLLCFATWKERFEPTAHVRKLADAHLANGDATLPPPTKKQRSEGASSEEAMTQWRVNMQEFMVRFRHQLLTQQVQRCFHDNDEPAAVVALIMHLSRLKSTPPEEFDTKESCSFAIDYLQQSKHRLSGSLSAIVNAESFSVAKALRTLCKHEDHVQLNMVGRSTLSDEYFINYESAMSAAQIRHCLCWVKAKYGEQGMRVFKVLADAEEVQMEQRTVADKALIVEKDARELLYRMTADGIISMQEVHKSNDMAPSRSFYTWRVSEDWPELRRACVRSLLRAAANTLSLLLANRDKAGPLLSRVLQRGEGKKESAAMQQYRRTEAVLMATLTKLEQELCLFQYRWTTTAVT